MWLRIGLVAALAGAATIAWALGLFEWFTRDNVQTLVEDAGPFGPVLFVLLFAVAELLHFPAILFFLVASIAWPAELAIPLAFLGAMAAAILIFTVARYLGREAVQRRLPDGLRKYEERLVTHGLLTVIGLRLVLFMLPAVHWLLGFSRVRWWEFLVGSAIGLLPGVVIWVLVGEALIENWDSVRPYVWVAVGLFVAARITQRVLRRRRLATEADSRVG